jgi:hypothetical protein
MSKKVFADSGNLGEGIWDLLMSKPNRLPRRTEGVYCVECFADWSHTAPSLTDTCFNCVLAANPDHTKGDEAQAAHLVGNYWIH